MMKIGFRKKRSFGILYRRMCCFAGRDCRLWEDFRIGVSILGADFTGGKAADFGQGGI